MTFIPWAATVWMWLSMERSLLPNTPFPTGQPIPLNHSSRSAMINEFFNTDAFVNPTCCYDSAAAMGNPQYIEQNDCTPFGVKYSLARAVWRATDETS